MGPGAGAPTGTGAPRTGAPCAACAGPNEKSDVGDPVKLIGDGWGASFLGVRLQRRGRMALCLRLLVQQLQVPGEVAVARVALVAIAI
eukprot:2635392-Pyramimonas_sp.AAC.1